MQVLSRRMRVKDSIVCAALDNESVLLNIETGIYFGLNTMGTQIWRLLEEGNSEDQLYLKLLEDYDIEPAQLQADLRVFFDLLLEKGLAEIGDA